ncbi:MAG: putative restriction-modification system methyltransferase [Rhodoglobus sp.]|nr:putative restriction-modification system methyltransferase [Rhodoglobus sp.]
MTDELLHIAERPTVHTLLQIDEVGLTSTGNAVINGDNHDAMRTLLQGRTMPSFAGTVRLCYLDPPYNTGAQFSTYSDSQSSAVWLDALRDRLVLVRALLSSDGSVWLHLDDGEQHHARVIMDEVFGREAFVATIVWQKRTSRDNRTAFSSSHDYIHVYAPLGAKDWKRVRNGLPDTGTFNNPDGDPRGPWRSTPMSAQAGHGTKAQFYTVVTPTGALHEPPPGRCWTYTAARLQQLDAEGRVYWPRNGDGRPRLKRYAYESGDLAPSTLWLAEFAGDTAEAKKELLSEFPGESVFDTPKPERLLERIIAIATEPDDLVMDIYLGSGTTAVSALKLGRRFIGIESSAKVVNEVAVPRISRQLDPHAGGFKIYEVQCAAVE